MFGKIFRFLAVPIRAALRFIDPRRDTMQAVLIKMLAGDVVRAYLQRNPKTAWTVHEISDVIRSLRGLANVSEPVAERVIRSVIHELAGYAGSVDVQNALNADNK